MRKQIRVPLETTSQAAGLSGLPGDGSGFEREAEKQRPLYMSEQSNYSCIATANGCAWRRSADCPVQI